MLCSLAKLDGDSYRVGKLIVAHLERYAIGHLYSLQYGTCLLVRVGSIVAYGIGTSLEPYHSVHSKAGGLRIVLRAVDRVIVEALLEHYQDLIDIGALLCIGVLDSETHRLDIAKGIGTSFACTSSTETLGLNQTERSLTARSNAH